MANNILALRTGIIKAELLAFLAGAQKLTYAQAQGFKTPEQGCNAEEGVMLQTKKASKVTQENICNFQEAHSFFRDYMTRYSSRMQVYASGLNKNLSNCLRAEQIAGTLDVQQ